MACYMATLFICKTELNKEDLLVEEDSLIFINLCFGNNLVFMKDY